MERLSADDAIPLARLVHEDVRKRVANWNALSQWPLSNVWIGTSIESDEYCWRADELRDIPVAIRFLSLEPLLGSVPSLELSGIDWVIIGGESGSAHRPLDSACDIRDRCVDLRVALFFKQVGWLAPKAGGAIRTLVERARRCLVVEVDVAGALDPVDLLGAGSALVSLDGHPGGDGAFAGDLEDGPEADQRRLPSQVASAGWPDVGCGRGSKRACPRCVYRCAIA
jgi:hypothetical protein